jgi:sRNA-binding protein
LLASCTPGTSRIDLAGNPAGHVTPEEAANTSAKLQRLAHKRAARKSCIKTTNIEPEKPTTRLGFAGLKKAALARKAAGETAPHAASAWS